MPLCQVENQVRRPGRQHGGHDSAFCYCRDRYSNAKVSRLAKRLGQIPMSHATGTIARGMLTSSGSKLLGIPLAILCSVVSVRATLDFVGPDEFGFVVMVGVLFQILPFADLGLGAPVVNAVSKAEESECARNNAVGTIQATKRILWRSAGTIMIVVSSMAAFGMWPILLGLPRQDSFWANWAVPLCLLPFAAGLPYSIGQRILVGLGKSHVANLYSGATPVVALAILYSLILANVDPYVLAVSTPVAQMVTSIASFRVASRIFNLAEPARLTRIDVRHEIWRTAGPMLVVTSIGPIAMQMSRIIVGRNVPSKELSAFTLAVTFYAPGYSMISAAAIVLWPIFARAETRSFHTWVRASAILTIGGLAIGVAYVVISSSASQLITHNTIQIPLDVSLGLGVLLVANSVLLPAGMLLTDSAGLTFQACFGSVALMFSTILAVATVSQYGSAGPIWAVAVTMIFLQTIPTVIRAMIVLHAVNNV